MSTQVYQLSGGGQASLPNKPIISSRSPTTTDIISPAGNPYQILQGWENTTTGQIYEYTGGGIWVLVSSSSGGPIETITGDTGGAEGPLAGNFNIKGTTNQITVTGSANTETLSVPTTFVAPGSIAATTTLTATAGAITATNGNLVLGTAGNKLSIATGANASVGVSGAMSGTPGTVTVSSTAITTSSVILYSRATTGGTEGNVSISAQPTGSFTLTSTGNETSTFNYLIIN